MSLNDWAYTEEEKERLQEEEDLENQIVIEYEIDNENKIQKAIDVKLEDLERVRSQLENAGGMTRAIASEAAVIMPEFKEKYPIGYFSSEPSKIGYNTALEEINLAQIAGVAAAAAAFIALISKFISWFTGGSSSGGAGGGGGGAVKVALKQKKIVEERTESEKEFLNQLNDIVGVKGLKDENGHPINFRTVKELREWARKNNPKLAELLGKIFEFDESFMSFTKKDNIRRRLINNDPLIVSYLKDAVGFTKEMSKFSGVAEKIADDYSNIFINYGNSILQSEFNVPNYPGNEDKGNEHISDKRFTEFSDKISQINKDLSGLQTDMMKSNTHYEYLKNTHSTIRDDRYKGQLKVIDGKALENVKKVYDQVSHEQISLVLEEGILNLKTIQNALDIFNEIIQNLEKEIKNETIRNFFIISVKFSKDFIQICHDNVKLYFDISTDYKLVFKSLFDWCNDINKLRTILYYQYLKMADSDRHLKELLGDRLYAELKRKSSEQDKKQ